VALEKSYSAGITDEFVEPICIDTPGLSSAMETGDVVICFNFRTDRCREITEVLTQQEFPDLEMKPLDLHYVTMTNYKRSFTGVEVVFEKDNLKNTLGEVISDFGATQIRIAETEKYPHVTFFFSGGRESTFNGEDRIMVNSPKVATYDLQPEMSAPQVVEEICNRIESNPPDFFCLNFANPDMVGHTGVYEAIKKACEATDSCLQEVIEAGQKADYRFVIIADHGNADCAVNEDGSPNTAHTTNPVPVFILDPDVLAVSDGVLADVAPTVLQMMGIPKPEVMTGSSLVR
jgi:2,3-bisphosphoglycerate-independent phosphoglycerate mutase